MNELVQFNAIEEINIQIPGRVLRCGSFFLNDNILVCSNNELIVIHNKDKLSYVKIPLIFCKYIVDLRAVFGVGSVIPELSFFDPFNDFNSIISEQVRIKDVFITDVYYSSQSKVLITSGSTMEFYKIDYDNLQHSDRKITLTHFKSFSESVLGKPSIKIHADERNQRLFVPLPNGYMITTITGDILKINDSLSTQAFLTQCVYFYQESRFDYKNGHVHTCVDGFKYTLMTLPNGMIQVWDSSDIRQFVHTSHESSFYFTEFCTEEFVIIIPRSMQVSLLNIRTGKTQKLFELEKVPEFIQLIRYKRSYKLFIILDQKVIIYRIQIPWKTWLQVLSTPLRVLQFQSKDRTPRIGIQTSDGSVILITPNTERVLTDISCTDNSHINNFYYNREQEIIDILVEDGSLLKFDLNDGNYELIDQYRLAPVNNFVVTDFPNGKVFALVQNGDLQIYSYHDCQLLESINISKVPSVAIYSHGDYIVTVFSNFIVLNNINDIQQTKIIRFPQILRSAKENELYCFQTSSNEVSIYKLDLDELKFIEVYKISIGTEIKYIDVQCGCYIYITKENQIVFGTLSNSLVTVESPFEVFYAGFLNTSGDLLIGLDREIMIIRRDDYYSDFEGFVPFDSDNSFENVENMIFCDKAICSAKISRRESGDGWVLDFNDSRQEYSKDLVPNKEDACSHNGCVHMSDNDTENTLKNMHIVNEENISADQRGNIPDKDIYHLDGDNNLVDKGGNDVCYCYDSHVRATNIDSLDINEISETSKNGRICSMGNEKFSDGINMKPGDNKKDVDFAEDIGNDTSLINGDGKTIEEYSYEVDENGNIIGKDGSIIHKNTYFIDDIGKIIDQDGNTICSIDQLKNRHMIITQTLNPGINEDIVMDDLSNGSVDTITPPMDPHKKTPRKYIRPNGRPTTYNSAYSNSSRDSYSQEIDDNTLFDQKQNNGADSTGLSNKMSKRVNFAHLRTSSDGHSRNGVISMENVPFPSLSMQIKDRASYTPIIVRSTSPSEYGSDTAFNESSRSVFGDAFIFNEEDEYEVDAYSDYSSMPGDVIFEPGSTVESLMHPDDPYYFESLVEPHIERNVDNHFYPFEVNNEKGQPVRVWNYQKPLWYNKHPPSVVPQKLICVPDIKHKKDPLNIHSYTGRKPPQNRHGFAQPVSIHKGYGVHRGTRKVVLKSNKPLGNIEMAISTKKLLP